MFDATNWYWLADDGRLYGSARQATVENSEDDELYLAWIGLGNRPTKWPSDETGTQTEAALAAVLQPYGLALWPVPLKDQLASFAADKRWRIETSGITVGGVPVATDDRSKIMIIGARVKADGDPNFTTEWKTPAGFATINAAAVIAISDAVLAHVDACFAAEAVVLAQIEVGAITTTAEIDAADWPG
ncbi:MAG TPA: DUF4376 domain-containing protein [Mesorhizobium sp.]|jgi:hypothetical protein|uniref:DUF4376 domain-containing protein n=1 Tax=Mesorhizobium sp. TaxID=1871066 RepID=UPI002DDD415D|nr:DUF4376 domain-containing protein [Mesorhizobium sp.]HEV2504394.1 DUF4376 domain-containing protein [Mesorhizobium sp.]